jgi:hypothetical protein
MFDSRAGRLTVFTCLLFLLAAPAQASIVLTLDDLTIVGAPGDVFTVTGSIAHVDPSEDLAAVLSHSLTSTVLQVLSIDAPDSVPYPAGYTGDIVTLQILSGAAPGIIPSNPFSITYDSINGRTFTTNSLDFSVEVAIPEPRSSLLVLTGLAALAARFLSSRCKQS